MYLKRNWIRFLKVKNVFLLLIGLFLFFTGAAYLVDEIVYYWGNLYVALHAVSALSSAIMMCIGFAMFVCLILSRKAILRAGFYSSYFEGALYNSIKYEEISEVSGYSRGFVRLDLMVLRPLYMKNFDIYVENGEEYIELYSKKIQCSCKNCGAEIDKQVYFTGFCPYCKTADVFATVLTGDRVYSIKSDFDAKQRDKSHYICKNFILRLVLITIAFTIATCVFVILGCMFMDYSSKVNDPEYLRDVLLSGKSYSSYELIQKDMVSTMIWAAFFAAMAFPVMFVTGKRFWLLILAKEYAEDIVRIGSPYVNVEDLSRIRDLNRRTIRHIRMVLQARYMRNCSVVKQDNVLKVAVARRIVKDECPTCGAPIIGAVDENYTCKFCKNRIMNVIIPS